MQLSLLTQGPADPRKQVSSPLADEAQYRYLHYAMSVITARALPDCRDGLKPVQRRILYAMFHDQRLLPDAKHKKCAAVVGDVLGKYHPHGDSSVYEALVRMAQDFSLRMPLIDGHGNFGSQDGDAAAAYRYTECRLRTFALELLLELGQETVSFRPTFDGMRTEPVLLPARVPQLLINGTQGIAVGMATSIPPHHPGEVIDACLMLLEEPGLETADLLKKIKGPDFPTAGELLCTKNQLVSVYEQGHGTLKLRGQYKVPSIAARGPVQVVIDSIPYGVTRAAVLEKIQDICADKTLPALLQCRDESTDQVRIVLELKPGTDPHLVMAYLFRHTPLQTSVHVNMTCLVPSENPDVCIPRQLSLIGMLRAFLDFRMDVVTKRTTYELEKLQGRIHILGGFATVYGVLDETLAIIRRSKGKPDAAQKLMARFGLDAQQVDAILELKLYRLARLEIDVVEQERAEKMQAAAALHALLDSEDSRWSLIREELIAAREAYPTKRLTRISVPAEETPLDLDQLTTAEDGYLVITREGWIKRMGSIKDVTSLRVRELDAVGWILIGSTKSTFVVFTDKGMVYTGRIGDIPASTGYGEPLQKFFAFQDQERVLAAYSLDPRTPIANMAWLLVSRQARTLRAPLAAFAEVSTKKGRRCMRLQSTDVILSAHLVSENACVSSVSTHGHWLSCAVSDIPLLQAAGQGVRLMNLSAEDTLVAATPQLPITLETDQGKTVTLDKHASRSTRGGKGKPLLKKSKFHRQLLNTPTLPVFPKRQVDASRHVS